MASRNLVILIGNLGKDPTINYTTSGKAVCNFSVATSQTFKNKDGEKQEATEWHNIVVWNKLAEVCGEYLTKGKQVYIEGSLRTRKWEDKEGQTRYTTEVIAQSMQMLGAKDETSPAKQEKEEMPSSKADFELESGFDPEEPPF